MQKKVITKKDLDAIFSHSRKFYVDDSSKELDNQQFTSQCFLKSVILFLGIEGEFEFPTRKDATSIDDENA